MTATLTSPVDFGTVTLTELSKATRNYLDNEVEVRVTDVTRNLNEDGNGTFIVRATNSTADRGVRLHDVTIHLESGNGNVILLQPPLGTFLESRESGDRDEPRLSTNDKVEQLYVFFQQPESGLPQDDVLDPGESLEIEGRYHGEGRGATTISAHVHASVHVEDVFPRTRSEDVARSVTIG